MVHIPKMCYMQYRNASGNTTFDRNKEIQRLVRYVSTWYDQKIHERLEELGVEDYIWKPGESSFWSLQRIPSPSIEQHCTVEVM